MLRLLLFLLFLPVYTFSQAPSPFIHVDQFGYHVTAEKVAVLSDPQIGFNNSLNYSPSGQLEVIDNLTGDIELSVTPQLWNSGATHDQSGDRGWWLDFSSITTPGQYYIRDVANDERSATFVIDDIAYNEVLIQAGRSFYYNRCNMDKAMPYADANWVDGSNFLFALQDANCRYFYDAGNATLEKDLSGGWFDAGDYNKYVTFAHFPVHTLLTAFYENPQAFGDNWNIPESGNGIPDIIDEVIYELNWLLKMNNFDGSTIIKMGSQNHSENIAAPPSNNFDQRFYGHTCTSASLTIASTFAHAALILNQFPQLHPLCDTLKARSIKSWQYVIPFITSGQLETACDDGAIVAGDADWNVNTQLDAAITASLYLYELTGNMTYHNYFVDNYNSTEQITNSFWGVYRMPLNDALLRYTMLTGINSSVSDSIINSLESDASNNWNGYYGFNSGDLYRAFIPTWSYHWGSNMSKANYGNLNSLLIKYNILPGQHDAYENYMRGILHYFHGINPLGTVYLSNMSPYGAERSCNEIYHTWYADGTDWDNAQTSLYGPAPGFVPGGPNKDFSVTTISPPAGQPAQKSYLDFNTSWPDNSWEITEPAIYYQAAYIRLLANFVDDSGTSDIGNIRAELDRIEVFPNPTNQFFVLKGELSQYTIDLLDASGQVLINLNTISNELIVDISTLGSGLFLIRLQHDSSNTLAVQKIIKLN